MKECPQCHHCYEDVQNHCTRDGKKLVASINVGPTISGRYMLERRLGKGGMGIVFKAKHNFLKSSHAIKIISPEIVDSDESLLIRFRQEAVLAASIRHPNIVSVTDFGIENDNLPFLVMDYIEGVSLSEFIQKEAPLSPVRTLEILEPLILGISEAHRAGIVHRDLKPLNIIIQKDRPLQQAVKILDFGLAKIKSTEGFGSLVQAETVNVVGTPYYMSPEQWSNEKIDYRADIYSLGVILYQMLTGKVPFKADSTPKIMYKHLTEQPPPFESHGIPPAPRIETVIKHLLAKDPLERPDSAEIVLAEFKAAVENVKVSAPPSPVKVESGSKLDSDFELEKAAQQFIEDDSEFLTETQRSKILPFIQSSIHEGQMESGELARRFLQAQQRLANARERAAEAGRLEKKFNESYKTAEEARLRALEAQQRIAADLRRDSLSEMSKDFDKEETVELLSSETAQTDTNDQIEIQVKRLEAEAVQALEQAAEARRQAEREAQKRQQAEEEYLAAEAEAQKLAAEILAKQNQGDDAGRNYDLPDQKQPARGKTASAANTAQNRLGVNSDRFNFQQTAEDIDENPPGRSLSSGKSALFAAAASVFLVVALGGSYYLFFNKSASVGNQTANANAQANASNTPATNTAARVQQKMVSLPGGTFQMGRNDVDFKDVYQINQYPAHRVRVEAFYIDKTEVTNEEYAEFVTAKNYPAPKNWANGKYPAGQEKFPVIYVSFEDAVAFANWLSTRDNLSYRLPSEEEWEYAARSGSQQNLFPWGSGWIEGKANILTKTIKPVGTSEGDRTAVGAIEDMLGNVMELTSSQIAPYPNATYKSYEDKIVVRGRSYSDEPNVQKNKFLDQGLTRRLGLDSNQKSDLVGFRLVCQP